MEKVGRRISHMNVRGPGSCLSAAVTHVLLPGSTPVALVVEVSLAKLREGT